MDLRKKINEAIDNDEFETAETLIQELYEIEFSKTDVDYPDDFSNKIIASSKGDKKIMNSKLKKFVVAASCTLMIGITGFTVNAATNGEVMNNIKTFIMNVGGIDVEAKQYDDKNGTNTEYEIYDFKVKETKLKNGDVNINIYDKDSDYSSK
ncbi:hypothetical protein [Intestinibacter sp.]